jgi:putative transposase
LLFGATAVKSRPSSKWVADLTRILTGEGVLWLASVRDAFSNKVVGWDSGPRADTELVLSALDYAVLSRDIRDGQLIQHSDKGCQPSTRRCGSPSASSMPASLVCVHSRTPPTRRPRGV